MAEIKKHVSKDGKVSYKVKIFLGRFEGKKKFKIKTIRGKKSDADAWARQQETLRDTGKLPLDDKITVKEYLGKFLKQIETRVRQHTLRGYEEYIERYVHKSELANVPLVKLKTYHVQDFYNEMVGKDLSARTIEYMHAILNGAFEHAVGIELLDRNPAKYAQRPVKKKPQIVCFNKEQAEKFLVAAKDDKYHVLFVIALTLGLRYEELAGLRWSDIDFNKHTLSVRQVVKIERAIKKVRAAEAEKANKSGAAVETSSAKKKKKIHAFYFDAPKTMSSRRTLRLADSQAALLKEQRKKVLEARLNAGGQWRNYDLVFPASDGSPIRLENLRVRHYKKILNSAGLKHFTFHSLRHSFATLTLLATRDVKTVSEMLGHSNVAFTMQTYTHVLEEMKERAASKIEEIFFTNSRATANGGGGLMVDNLTG